MRILLLGRPIFDATIDGVANALARRHEVLYYEPKHVPGPLSRFIRGPLEQLAGVAIQYLSGHEFGWGQKGVREAARRLEPDWIFVLSDSFVTPETVDWIRTKTPSVITLWYMDHLGTVRRWEFLSAPYTAKFYVDAHLYRLETERLRHEEVFQLSMGYDETRLFPEEFPEDELRPYRCEVATYGNVYPWRAEMLRHLSEFDLRVYGTVPRWLYSKNRRPLQGYDVRGRDKVRAMRACEVAVNTASPGNVAGVNKRAYELAGMKVFQVTDNPAADEAFDPETEVAQFRDARDLREKVRYYLARPTERAEMATRAQRRARKNYTFGHRLDEMIERISALRERACGPLATPWSDKAGT